MCPSIRPMDVIYITRFAAIRHHSSEQSDSWSFGKTLGRLADGLEQGRFIVPDVCEEALSLRILNLDDAILGIVQQGAERVVVSLANQMLDGNQFSEQDGAVHEESFKVALWQDVVSRPIGPRDVI